MVSKPRTLKRLIPAFALALMASLALGALAAGSASALSIKNGNGTNPVFGSSPGAPTIQVQGGATIKCAGSNFAGSYQNSTSGTAHFDTSNCKEGFGFACTTPGQVAGTIASTSLNFKLIYLDSAKTKFGLMISPASSVFSEPFPGFLYENPSGVFTEFKCGNNTYKVTGSVINQITSPALNVSSETFMSVFGIAGGGAQLYQQIEGAGSKFHLSAEYSGFKEKETTLSLSQPGTYVNGKSTFIP